MPIETRCPSCDKDYLLADSQAGKRVRCRHCDEPFLVPSTPRSVSERRSSKSTRFLDQDEGDEVPARSGKVRRDQSDFNWVLVSILGGIAVAVALLVGGLGFWLLLRVQKMPAPVALAPAPPLVWQAKPPAFDPNVLFAEPRTVDQALQLLARPEALNRLRGAEFFIHQNVDAGRHKEVARALEKQFKNEQDPFARDASLKALTLWGDQETAEIFVQIASTTQDHNTWNTVIDALVKRKEKRAGPIAARNLNQLIRRGKAADVLRRLGPEVGPSVEPVLQSLLQDKNLSVRREAVKLLGELGSKASLPLLEQASQNNRDRSLAPIAREAIQAINKRS